MFPFVKRAFTQDQFQGYVQSLQWTQWRPKKIVWHNTAAPSLTQWIKSGREDQAKGKVPGASRMQALENFYKNNQGWSGGPHLFIANDLIWVANPLTARGTHSPSFNATAIGIEMIGDFSREDDNTGVGLDVKNNTIFATAILCDTLGLDPFRDILLHKEDPKTTHDCPGKNIAQDKDEMISKVISLMEGGDHNAAATAVVIAGKEPTIPFQTWEGRTNVKDLNFRIGPGVSHRSIGKLPKGTSLTILAEAKNVNDAWLQARTPMGYLGWVSGRYVEKKDA